MPLQENHRNQNKENDEWQQDEKPRNGCRTRFTNQIQNPSPKENIYEFDCENQICAGHIARMRPDAIGCGIPVILEEDKNNQNR